MDWQPIETAPKDGSRVLINRKGYAEPICVGWYSQDWKEWKSVPGEWSWKPTHWMPLPDPPKSE